MTDQRRAFTLVELLVVMAIIALLISLVVVGLKGARTSAIRLKSLNSLRSVALAYNDYSTDNDGKLMPGYMDPATLNDNDITARTEGGVKLSDADAASYVWRLLPYLDFKWETLLTDYHSRGIGAKVEIELSNGTYGLGTANWANDELGLGAAPSIGMNSIYVGGDTRHGGADATDFNPWTIGIDRDERMAATRFTEVKNPARLIVFGATGYHNQGAFSGLASQDVEFGYVELRPPWVGRDPDESPYVRQWELSEATKELQTLSGFNDGGGLPIARWGAGKVPVAHLDGSTVAEDLGLLGPTSNNADTPELIQSIMSRWSPWVVAPR